MASDPTHVDEPPPSRVHESTGDTPYTGAWTGTIPDDEEDDLIGVTLCNTYVIERVLGEGGMGRVYKARHTRIRRKSFAIKTLHPEYLRSPDVIKRFQREAEAAASIKSEHVIGVYDVDKAPDGRPFMVSELLDGNELGDFLDKRGKLSVPYAVGIVRQICKALSAAHAQNVVHRDMKPENVFLTGDMEHPHVKVLDFGISRLDDGEGQGLTKTGMIMGTPSYMPPEQARGERVDLRADVYATGAILYTALTGQVPFDRAEPAATVVAVLTEDPPRPRSLEPTIPDHLEAIIQRAMAKQPDERYASMAELHEALALYDTGAPLILATSGPSSLAGRPRAVTFSRDLEREAREVRDARPLFVLLVVLIAVALVAGLLTAVSSIVMSLRGTAVTVVELIIGAVAFFAATATPAFLVVRNVKATTWDNSVRMVVLVETLKAPLIAGVSIYGGGWLLVATVDHVFVGRASWTGWDAALYVLALVAALATRAVRKREGDLSRMLATPIMSIALSAFAMLTMLVVVLMLRDDSGAALVTSNGDGRPDASAGPATSASAGSEDSAASAESLAKAKKGGAAALATLHQQHPKDSIVLRALVLELGKSDRVKAVEAAEKLHDLDDKALQDEEIVSIIKRAADGPADQRAKALALMALRMGSKGIDLLYEISKSTSPGRSDARHLLSTDAVRKNATPAVLIAHDMREANGCSAKAALLERAAKDGDKRTILLLEPLTVGSKSGCGFLKLGACPAKCHQQAARMRRAIQTIRGRAG